jgi:HK97 family phage major capsid protein
MILDEMKLEDVTLRLAELDETVRAAEKIEDIEAAEVEKKSLLERKTELEDLETRKKTALEITQNKVQPIVKEFKEERNMDRVITPEMPEYRELFYKRLMNKPMNDIEKRDYEVYVGGAGIAAVPTQTADMIFDNMTKIAPLLAEIQLFRIPGQLRFAVQNARVAAAVHVENAPTASAADTLQAITLAGTEFLKLLQISASMSAMSISAFESWLVKILAEDLAVFIDGEIINGPDVTGDISDGPWVEGVNQITYVPVNGLAHSNVMSLIALLPAQYDANAKFLMNKATFWTQFAAMEDANGNPIINPDLAAPGKYMVRGYPVLIDDNVLANEAYLGDFKQVVGNFSSEVKIEASKEAGFTSASTWYRGLAIFDCDVAQPGAIVKLNV